MYCYCGHVKCENKFSFTIKKKEICDSSTKVCHILCSFDKIKCCHIEGFSKTRIADCDYNNIEIIKSGGQYSSVLSQQAILQQANNNSDIVTGVSKVIYS